MILSPYRNPPYRAPTPHSSSAIASNPSASDSSPKRKRNDPSSSSTAAATLATYSADRAALPPLAPPQAFPPHIAPPPDDGLPPTSSPNSPRAKVAEKLRHLDLHPPSSSPPPRKRPRRDLALDGSPDPFVAETLQRSGNGTEGPDVDVEDEDVCMAEEVYEPPASRARTRPSSSPPLTAGLVTGESTLRFHETGLGISEAEAQRASLASSPPPAPPSTPQQTPQHVPLPSSPPPELPIPIPSTIDQAALTWRDDEITGHDLDARDIDDDGEGLNGIGFRPTPAVAYARLQRRRQQVSEWRAREGREARQRRFERRRGGGGGGGGSSSEVVMEAGEQDESGGGGGGGLEGGRRVVRFVGVG